MFTGYKSGSNWAHRVCTYFFRRSGETIEKVSSKIRRGTRGLLLKNFRQRVEMICSKAKWTLRAVGIFAKVWRRVSVDRGC